VRELLNEIVRRERRIGPHKHVHVVGHHFKAFNLYLKFFCLLVQQFAQAVFDFLHQHLPPVFWAKDILGKR